VIKATFTLDNMKCNSLLLMSPEAFSLFQGKISSLSISYTSVNYNNNKIRVTEPY